MADDTMLPLARKLSPRTSRTIRRIPGGSPETDQRCPGRWPLPDNRSAPQRSEPAVPVRQSVKADHLVCLECGQQFLNAEAASRYRPPTHPGSIPAEMGPSPGRIPIVAPDYAKVRSGLAKKIGLGRLPGNRPEGELGERLADLGQAAPFFPWSELEYSQDCDVLHTIRLG